MATTNCINSNNPVVQIVSASIGTVVTCSNAIPSDDTIPQNTEGTQVITISITPKYSNSILEIVFSGFIQPSASTNQYTIALFQDLNVNALTAKSTTIRTGFGTTGHLQYLMTSGTTSSTTFAIRMGGANFNIFTNSDTVGNPLLGGVGATNITITEYL